MEAANLSLCEKGSQGIGHDLILLDLRHCCLTNLNSLQLGLEDVLLPLLLDKMSLQLCQLLVFGRNQVIGRFQIILESGI